MNKVTMMNKTVPNYSYNNGVTVPLYGNIRTNIGSPHYNAHLAMEEFYNQYRKGGALFGDIPTVSDYNKALTVSLQNAGLTDIHGVVNRNPKPVGGIPNSSLDILDSSTGELLTRRFYDSSGKAYRDIDFTHHGNIGTHPEAPHEHFWTFSPNGGIVRK